MSKPYPISVAVIDIGKTNVKVVLIDSATGEQLDVHTMSNEVVSGPPYPHYDTDGIWAFILSALSKLAGQHKIDGISITTHGAAAALVDDTGLVLPVLDYEFSGPDTIPYDRPEFAETLSPKLPTGLNLGAQLNWLSHSFPEPFGRTNAILLYPQYWAWRLTGVRASEVTSLGVHTDLWRPSAGEFSSLVLDNAWDALFPPFLPAHSAIGTLHTDLAFKTGLSENTPVAVGIHDSNASLLPYLSQGSVSIISSGTWTIIMTLNGTLDHLDPTRDCLANVDTYGRAVPTARFMGGREYQILMDGISTEPELSDIQRIVDRDTMVLPSFTEGIGPYPNNKGQWINPPIGANERGAAVTLYLALMSKTCLELAGLGAAIVIEGPLAKNHLYCALVAALTVRPVYKSQDATGTSAGAAMLFNIAQKPSLGDPVAPAKVAGLSDYAAKWDQIAKDESR